MNTKSSSSASLSTGNFWSGSASSSCGRTADGGHSARRRTARFCEVSSASLARRGRAGSPGDTRAAPRRARTGRACARRTRAWRPRTWAAPGFGQTQPHAGWTCAPAPNRHTAEPGPDSAARRRPTGRARLVGGERQHDEVRIQSVDAVPRVGVRPRQPLLLPDVGHRFVLPLPGAVGVAQDHFYAAPARVRVQPQVDVILRVFQPSPPQGARPRAARAPTARGQGGGNGGGAHSAPATRPRGGP